jgi:hypothetical protein
VVNLRFRGITGVGFLSDMALDDIVVGTAFPVELLAFSAQLNDEAQVAISWVTASEVDNDFFTVERSADGWNFEELTQVNGAGTSQEIRMYETLDRRPFAGKSYYRLQQTDFNGASTYSDVVEISVPWQGNQSAYVSHPYPNPFTDRFHIDINLKSAGPVSAELFNSVGQRVRQMGPERRETGWHVLTIDAGQLPAGVYHVRISGNDFVSTGKAVLER